MDGSLFLGNLEISQVFYGALAVDSIWYGDICVYTAMRKLATPTAELFGDILTITAGDEYTEQFIIKEGDTELAEINLTT